MMKYTIGKIKRVRICRSTRARRLLKELLDVCSVDGGGSSRDGGRPAERLAVTDRFRRSVVVISGIGCVSGFRGG